MKRGHSCAALDIRLGNDPEFSGVIEKLRRLDDIESKLLRNLQRSRRLSFADKFESRVLTRFLRVFVRYDFVTATENDKSHFLVTVEGFLLDKNDATDSAHVVTEPINSKNTHHIPFGTFFDKISLQVERKNNPPKPMEYIIRASASAPIVTNPTISAPGNVVNSAAASTSAATAAATMTNKHIIADCYRFKVYSDKAISCTVYLTRSTEIKQRFEISSTLRRVMPNIRVDPTEDEILVALWEYVQMNSLYMRKTIRSDLLLRDIFSADTVPVTAIRQRLSAHMTAIRPIAVELDLSLGNNDHQRSTSSDFSFQGRVFDIEVDVSDDTDGEIVSVFNDMLRDEATSSDKIAQLNLQCNYISREINQSYQRITALESLVSRVFSDSSSNNSSSSINNAVCNDLECMDLSLVAGDDLSRFQLPKHNRHCLHETLADYGSCGGASTSSGSNSGLSFDLLALGDNALLLSQRNAISNSNNNNTATSNTNNSTSNAIDWKHTMVSAIHSCRGFIDVDDDQAFANPAIVVKATSTSN